MSIVNLALRFATELAGFAAIGYAAFQVAAPLPIRVALAAGAVAALIGIWAMLVAPKGPNEMPPMAKDLIGSVILLLVAAALGAAGRPELAVGFAVIVVVNTALLAMLGTEVREQLGGMGR
jgi:hypothetical protein